MRYTCLKKDYFNPRSPHGERLLAPLNGVLDDVFQSTLPARGATRCRYHSFRHTRFQSTLPARGATFLRRWKRQRKIFQSTLPARGATWLLLQSNIKSIHFNPRSPHGERLKVSGQAALRQRISIHAPRTGSDRAGCTVRIGADDFNPRSPHGERRHFAP